MGAGAGLVLWCALYLVVTAALRPWGIQAPMVAALVAALAVAGVLRWSLKLSPGLLLAALCGAVLASLVAVGLAAFWRDISYDGPAIHFPSALELSGGLNPFNTRPGMYFSAVYPNGLWTLQAFFIHLGPGIEEGKAPAWMLCFASLPLVAVALRQWRGGWTPAVALAALLVQANPVLLLQLTSFELDGVVYSLFVTAFAGAVLLNTPLHRVGLAVLLAAILLLVNTKITGLYWAGVVGLAVLGQQALAQRGPPWRMAAALLATAVVAVVLVGWRPYVTVPLETGQPLGATTGVVAAPANLQDAGPATRLAYLVWGESSNPVGTEPAQLKWPWQFSRSEFVTLLDIRVGGFGPGFGLQVLGALLATLAFAWRARGSWTAHWQGPFWVAVLVLGTALLPASWWARLASPFWLAMVLPLVWPLAPPASGAPAGGTRPVPLWVTGWLLVGAGLVVTSAATVSTLRLLHSSNQAITQVLAQVASEGAVVRIVPLNPLEQDHAAVLWTQRLLEAGIYPRIGDAAGCGQALFAVGSVRLCKDPGGL
jgi:hypothetical protein